MVDSFKKYFTRDVMELPGKWVTDESEGDSLGRILWPKKNPYTAYIEREVPMKKYYHAEKNIHCAGCRRIFDSHAGYCIPCPASQRVIDKEEHNMNKNTKNERPSFNNIVWTPISYSTDYSDCKCVGGGPSIEVRFKGEVKKGGVPSLNTPSFANFLNERMNGAAYVPEIKNVIFNPPATIVFWTDGTKTVVKTQNGEEFDPEKGLTMAYFKKTHGDKGSYFNEIKKWTEKYDRALTPSEVVSLFAKSFGEGFSAGITTSTISDRFDSLPCMKSDEDFIRKFVDSLNAFMNSNKASDTKCQSN